MAALAPAGLDLVHAFDAAAYDAVVADHASLTPLARFGRAHALAALVGNTRAMWPRFLAAYHSQPDLQASADPLDRFVTEAVTAAAARLDVPHISRFAHVQGPELVSMLRLADAAGFATLGPAHLAVHPEHGPWFGLRAVLVFDAPPPAPSPPPRVCEGCPAPCRGPFAEALERTHGDEDVRRTWRAWVAVRDACPVGGAHRYGPEQLEYHYTKDRRRLARAQ